MERPFFNHMKAYRTKVVRPEQVSSFM